MENRTVEKIEVYERPNGCLFFPLYIMAYMIVYPIFADFCAIFFGFGVYLYSEREVDIVYSFLISFGCAALIIFLSRLKYIRAIIVPAMSAGWAYAWGTVFFNYFRHERYVVLLFIVNCLLTAAVFAWHFYFYIKHSERWLWFIDPNCIAMLFHLPYTDDDGDRYSYLKGLGYVCVDDIYNSSEEDTFTEADTD